jgi:hypothetical protein
MAPETYEILIMIIFSIPVRGGLYMVWWIRKQEREERRNKLLP